MHGSEHCGRAEASAKEKLPFDPSVRADGEVMVAVASAASKRPPRILVRSSWQTVNIGDIAHTPGILRILETHLPDAELTLWPGRLDNGVDKLLQEAFPKVKIADDSAKRAAAMEECDFLLHGSGPSLVAEKDVKRWIAETGKPFGVYGITLPNTPRSPHD